MENNFIEKYERITGRTEFGLYRSPEEEASKIKKCTILKEVDITYSNEILGYTQGYENGVYN
ncbi:MAG: hypothetical protein NC254_02900 [bacterium]|nr:hypothetical protein [bacterium]